MFTVLLKHTIASFIRVSFPFWILALKKADLNPQWQLVILTIAFLAIVDKTKTFFLIAMSIFLLGLWHIDQVVRIYPFAMAMTFFLAFLASYRADKSVLETYAKNFVLIDDGTKIFLKKALKAWLFILGTNTFILFIFLFAGTTEEWALYSGLFSYLFLGLMILATIGFGHAQKIRLR